MRPRTLKKTYSIRLDDALRQRLNKWCERNEMQMSAAIRLAVQRLLESRKEI